jgi:UPF0489 domain
MARHIIPFAGRNHSGAVTQNLLWQDGDVYLMDNHRAALWCWQQAFDLGVERHRILHIDRHTDALGANLSQHLQDMPALRGLSIDDYLNAQVQIGSEKHALFRWDNYLSIHVASSKNTLSSLICADHGVGDNPLYHSTQRPRPDQLSENIGYWLRQGKEPWIVNVDLDYFFCSESELDKNGHEVWIPLFSDSYIESIFKQVRELKKIGRAKVVTVCLTPSSFTPGWQGCLNLSRKIFDILKVRHPVI